MKKLILTSSGFLIPSVRSIILEHLPSQRPLKVAYISTASKVVKDDTYARRDVEIMTKLGFDITEIDLADVEADYLSSTLPEHNIMYVQGGNGFLVARQRIGIHRLTRDLKFVGDVLGSIAHCPIFKGTPQAIDL